MKFKTFCVFALAAMPSLMFGGIAAAQYINSRDGYSGRVSNVVTAGAICNALHSAGFSPGASRDGHTLRGMSCSGSGHRFNVSIAID